MEIQTLLHHHRRQSDFNTAATDLVYKFTFTQHSHEYHIIFGLSMIFEQKQSHVCNSLGLSPVEKKQIVYSIPCQSQDCGWKKSDSALLWACYPAVWRSFKTCAGRLHVSQIKHMLAFTLHRWQLSMGGKKKELGNGWEFVKWPNRGGKMRWRKSWAHHQSKKQYFAAIRYTQGWVVMLMMQPVLNILTYRDSRWDFRNLIWWVTYLASTRSDSTVSITTRKSPYLTAVSYGQSWY